MKYTEELAEHIYATQPINRKQIRDWRARGVIPDKYNPNPKEEKQHAIPYAVQSSAENLQLKLKRFARQFTTDREEIKELIQETNMRLLLSNYNESYSCSLSTFAYGIMKNRWIDNMRAKERRESVFTTITQVDENHFFYSSSPESHIDRKEKINRIKHMLTQDDYDLLMYKADGYSHKKIGDIYGVSKDVIGNRLRKINNSLSDNMRERI